MSSHQPELYDHRIGAVSQRDDLVVLIGKGYAGVGVVAAHRFVAVVDNQLGDQLVTRMREGRQHIVPGVADLVVEMVEHEFLAGGQYLGSGKRGNGAKPN